MTKLVRIISKRKNNILNISWDPSNYCNFKCSYCYETANAGTHKPIVDLDTIVDNFRFLIDYYQKKAGKTKVHFTMAGGEPTLWKDLNLFISKIKEKHNVYFSLVTNGSRSIRWWEEQADKLDNVHISHHIAQGNVNHVIKVADICHARGCKTTVKVLMDPLHWNEGISDINFMKKHSKEKWFITISKVISQKNYLTYYTNDQLSFLKKEILRIPSIIWFIKNFKLFKDEIKLYESIGILNNGKKIYAKSGTYLIDNLNKFEGWNCSIGKDRLYIGWTGKISGSCGVSLFNKNVEYNILDTEFKSKFDPDIVDTICEKKLCICSPETHLNKFIPVKPIS